jgi:hypothetical protein
MATATVQPVQPFGRQPDSENAARSVVLKRPAVDHTDDHYYPPINKTQIEDLKQKLNVTPKPAIIANSTPIKQNGTQESTHSNSKKRTLPSKRNSIKVRPFRARCLSQELTISADWFYGFFPANMGSAHSQFFKQPNFHLITKQA